MFLKPNATHAEIQAAGEWKFYGCSTNSTLNKQRYLRYNQRIAKSRLMSTFKLESLPPTSDAAAQHSFRAYHTIQQSLGNVLHAKEWVFYRVENQLRPIMSTKACALDILLNMISCGCKTACGCRKIGMPCSAMCNICLGQTCTNVPKYVNNNELVHREDDLLTDIEFNDIEN